jgi:hypothetical protein
MAKINLPALPGGADGFSTVAGRNRGLLVGDVLKFKRGRFLAGRHEHDLTGKTLCGHAATKAWQGWSNENVLVGEIIFGDSNEPFPETAEEAAARSIAPAKWQMISILYCRDMETGEDFSFISGSFGGRMAVGNLASQILNKRQLCPGALPLVRLEAGEFKSRQYGMVPCPIFAITSWIDPQGRPITNNTTADDLNDEIPY